MFLFFFIEIFASVKYVEEIIESKDYKAYIYRPKRQVQGVVIDIYPTTQPRCLEDSDLFHHILLNNDIAVIFLRVDPAQVGHQDNYGFTEFSTVTYPIHDFRTKELPKDLGNLPCWLMGTSFGGTTAAYYALYSEWPNDFDGYICISSFTGWRPEGILRPPTGISFLRKPNALKKPLWVVHGTGDYVSSIGNFYNLVDKLKGDRLFFPLVITGMGHFLDSIIKTQGVRQKLNTMAMIIKNSKKEPPKEFPISRQEDLDRNRPIVIGPSECELYYQGTLDDLQCQFLGRLLTNFVSRGSPCGDTEIKDEILKMVPSVIALHSDSNNEFLKQYLFAAKINPGDTDIQDISRKMKNILGIDIDRIKVGAVKAERMRRSAEQQPRVTSTSASSKPEIAGGYSQVIRTLEGINRDIRSMLPREMGGIKIPKTQIYYFDVLKQAKYRKSVLEGLDHILQKDPERDGLLPFLQGANEGFGKINHALSSKK